MNKILSFSNLTKTDISVVGGKGANLGEMTQAGFPVPEGFVISTNAYDEFVEIHNLKERIIALASTVSAIDPKSAEGASNKINALFSQNQISANLASEITNAYQQLVGTNTEPVAVRSSATAEDLPEASFAGQQDTFLNIRGEDTLLDAVKKCWASLWTARAILYRLRQEIEPASVSLAVVVQRLVPAEASGILFTANPVNGARNQILINATWGLGEAIVGGLVTPDTVVVSKPTNEILSRETATKIMMTVQTETGTEEQVVGEALQNHPAINDESALELAQMGVKIETHYGIPMDIEWAISKGEVSILQARPITSLPPAPLENVEWHPITPKTIWMRRQIVEHMPEPVSPLFEDLYLLNGLTQSMENMMEGLSEISGATFDLGKMMAHGFAGTINGYAYTTGSFKMSPGDFIAILRIYARMRMFLNAPFFNWDEVVFPAYQGTITRWGAEDLAETTDEDLLHGIREMATADSTYWFGSAANLGFSRLTDFFFNFYLKSFLVRNALPKPRPGSASFLRGFDSKALDAQADMETIAALIRETPALRELVHKTSAEHLIEALEPQPDGEIVVAGIKKYLDNYGHQFYNLDFAAPTQSENPQPMLLSLKALVDHPPEQDARTRQARMAEEREALVAQTEQALNPISRRLFQWLWKWTKHWAPYREEVMFHMGAAWPTLRKVANELGQRLTQVGAIAEPDDIYYLNGREISEAIKARHNRETAPNFAELTIERRALRKARMLLAPPAKVPQRGSLKLGPFKLSMFDPTPNEDVDTGPVLKGYAVSTGRVTAPASVIYSHEDFNKMKPGMILVCTTTTPAWTPLFSQAVGLVTDVGGALAHGSIVAREYGIPAVMGTGVATNRIKSGMMLTVDGDAGTVTIVDEADQKR